MADQEFYTLKQGASGSAFTATMKQQVSANTMAPIDLSDYESVHFVVRKAGRPGRVINGECTINPDQVTLKGKVRYEFTEITAAIATGTYDVEFHGIDETGDLHIWPSNRQYTYGKLYVEQPI